MRIPRDLPFAATVVALLMISPNAGAQEPQRSLNPARLEMQDSCPDVPTTITQKGTLLLEVLGLL